VNVEIVQLWTIPRIDRYQFGVRNLGVDLYQLGELGVAAGPQEDEKFTSQQPPLDSPSRNAEELILGSDGAGDGPVR
jgi:hypothetical protein